MMTPALLCLPGPDECLHCLENLVHATHVPIHKMSIVDLKKPMIFLILFVHPMTFVDIFFLIHRVPPLPLSFGCLGWFFFLSLLMSIQLNCLYFAEGQGLGVWTHGETVIEVKSFLFLLKILKCEKWNILHEECG